VWDWTSESKLACRLQSNASQVEQVVVSPDQRWLIAGCSDGITRVWNFRHAQLLALTRPTDDITSGDKIDPNETKPTSGRKLARALRSGLLLGG